MISPTTQSIAFGARLAKVRASSGLSARKFALSIGCDPSQYLKTEQGQYYLSQSLLTNLFHAYRVDLTWLITGEQFLATTDVADELLEITKYLKEGMKAIHERKASKNNTVDASTTEASAPISFIDSIYLPVTTKQEFDFITPLAVGENISDELRVVGAAEVDAADPNCRVWSYTITSVIWRGLEVLPLLGLLHAKNTIGIELIHTRIEEYIKQTNKNNS